MSEWQKDDPWAPDPEVKAVIHVSIFKEAPEADRDRLMDAIAVAAYDLPREGWDPLVTMHTDGDCAASLHCEGMWRNRALDGKETIELIEEVIDRAMEAGGGQAAKNALAEIINIIKR